MNGSVTGKCRWGEEAVGRFTGWHVNSTVMTRTVTRRPHLSFIASSAFSRAAVPFIYIKKINKKRRSMRDNGIQPGCPGQTERDDDDHHKALPNQSLPSFS